MRRVSAKFDITAEDKTKGAFGSATKGIDMLKRGFMSIAAPVAGLAGVGGLTLLIKKMAETGDQFQKMSLRTGESVENLSALSFAAQRSGTDIDALEKSLKYASMQMIDIKRGSGEAKATFDELGIAVVGSDGKLRSATDVLIEAADKISIMTNETEQLTYAAEIFGARTGTELLPLLKEGSKGIQELMERSRALGGVWSTEDAEAAAAFQDSLTDLKLASGGLGRIIAVSLMPPLTELASATATWIGNNQELIDQKVDEYVASVGEGLSLIWENRDAFSEAFSGVADTASALKDVVGYINEIGNIKNILNMEAIKAIATADSEFDRMLALIKYFRSSYPVLGGNGGTFAFGGGYAGSSGVSGAFPAPPSTPSTPSNVIPFAASGSTYTGGLSMFPGAGSRLGGFTGRGMNAGLNGVNENSFAAMSAMMSAREMTFEFETATEDVLDTASSGWLSLSDDISMVLANAEIAHDNFFSAVIRGFEDMFTKLTAMYAAKSAVFGLFSLFGGGDLLGGSLTKFLFPSFASGGVVSRPTLAVVGDDPRGPERVLNASENRAYEQGRGGTQIGTFNLTISGAEKQAMHGDNDRQLAERITRLIRMGHIKLGVA